MANICPSCGASNLRSAHECTNCKTALGDAPAPAPSPEASGPARPHAAAVFKLVQKDWQGTAAAEHEISAPETVLGRSEGQVVCGDDPKLSRRHAMFRLAGRRMWVQDLGSTNGTYLRFRGRRPWKGGESLLIGKQILRVDVVGAPPPGEGGDEATAFFGDKSLVTEVLLTDSRGTVLNKYPLTTREAWVGRSADLLGFPQDALLAARHARLELNEQGLFVEDLGSAVGCYYRIRTAEELNEGDQLRAGDQFFQVERIGS